MASMFNSCQGVSRSTWRSSRGRQVSNNAEDYNSCDFWNRQWRIAIAIVSLTLKSPSRLWPRQQHLVTISYKMGFLPNIHSEFKLSIPSFGILPREWRLSATVPDGTGWWTAAIAHSPLPATGRTRRRPDTLARRRPGWRLKRQHEKVVKKVKRLKG